MEQAETIRAVRTTSNRASNDLAGHKCTARTIVDPQYLHVLREVVVFMTPPVLGNIAHQDARGVDRRELSEVFTQHNHSAQAASISKTDAPNSYACRSP